MQRQTRNLSKIQATAVAALALLLALHAGDALAAASATDLNDPGYMTNAFNKMVTLLNAGVNRVLANGPYMAWARNLLIGAFVIKIFETLFRYVWGNASIGDIVEVLFIGLIVTALYRTYSDWSTAIFMACFELGRLVQGQAIGDTGIMAPVIFLNKVMSSITVRDTSFFSLGILEVIMGLIVMVGEVLVAGASFFAALWPSLVFAVIKLTGPVVFFSLFHERLSWIFDGWLRSLIAVGFLALVGRITLVVICIMYQAMFDIGYSQSSNITTIVITTENFGTFLYVLAAQIVSFLLLFAASGIAAKLVAGSDIGIGKTVGSIARSIAMSLI